MPERPPSAPSRRRGRPPVQDGDQTVNLSVRVSSRQFDGLYLQARLARMTLACCRSCKTA
jgi:hypothetical protein